MKSLDLLSRRILVCAIAASMICLSAGFLVRSISPAHAAPPAMYSTAVYPVGVSGTKAYWLEYGESSGWQFRSEELSEFK